MYNGKNSYIYIYIYIWYNQPYYRYKLHVEQTSHKKGHNSKQISSVRNSGFSAFTSFNKIKKNFHNETMDKLLKKDDETNLLPICQPLMGSSSFERML